MSQQNRQVTPAPANTPISKEQIEQARQELEKMNPQERSALLKELERELQSETSQEAAPLLEFVLKNIKKIILALVAIVIIIIAVNVINWNHEKNMQEARAELSSISQMQDLYVKLDALDAFLKRAPKELQTAVMMEEVTTSLEAEEYEYAIAKLQNIIMLEQGKALSYTMTIALADVYKRTNQPEKALVTLEDIPLTAPDDIRNTALEDIASIAETLGNSDRAIVAYEELLTIESLSQAHPYYKERIQALSN